MTSAYTIRLSVIGTQPSHEHSVNLANTRWPDLDALHEVLCDLMSTGSKHNDGLREAIKAQITQEHLDALNDAEIDECLGENPDDTLYASFHLYVTTKDPAEAATGQAGAPGRAETLRTVLSRARERVARNPPLLRRIDACDAQANKCPGYDSAATRWSPRGALLREASAAQPHVPHEQLDTMGRGNALVDEAIRRLLRALPEPGPQYLEHHPEDHYSLPSDKGIILTPQHMVIEITASPDVTTERVLEAFERAVAACA